MLFYSQGWVSLGAKKVSNIGYAIMGQCGGRFMPRLAKKFCEVDEYNWDIMMWATVYPSLSQHSNCC
jgi:transcription elongation factor Elf1